MQVNLRSTVLFEQEVGTLKSIFSRNSYPLRFFDTVLAKFMQSREPAQDESCSSEVSETLGVFLRIPYIGRPSHEFGKRLSGLLSDRFGVDANVVFSTFKVGSYFRLKSKTPPLFKSNIVYKFCCPCDEDMSYIGMTVRQWFVRIEEHFCSSNSAMRTHLRQCRPCRISNPKSQNFTTLKSCRTERDTEIREAMMIRRDKPRLNVQLGAFQGSSFLLRVFK